MRFLGFSKALLGAMVSVVAVLGAAGGAHAGVIVTGDWDPAIGGPFNLLGWRGHALFDVPAGCLGAGPVSVLSTDPCAVAGGGLNFLGATVEFYKLSDVALPAGAPTIDTVVYGAGTISINGIDVLAGQVKRVDSAYTAFAPTTLGNTFNGLDLYGFSIRFDSAFDATLVYGGKIIGGAGGYVGTPASNELAGRFAQAPVVYNNSVPEPTSLVLVGGALALAARALRRRA
jgi:hypothetical protein